MWAYREPSFLFLLFHLTVESWRPHWWFKSSARVKWHNNWLYECNWCIFKKKCNNTSSEVETRSSYVLLLWNSSINIYSFSFYCSSAKRTDATHTATPWSVLLDKWGPTALPFLLIRIYLSTTTSGALPNFSVWQSMHAAQQHHGHREHLWTGCQDAV